MTYVVPVAVDWPGTIIAVNVGGAVIPVLLSLYLMAKKPNIAPWPRRRRLRGGGMPYFGSASSRRRHRPSRPCAASSDGRRGAGAVAPLRSALAFIGGSLGTLIGADLLNLDKLQGLGAPVASIGGAGTFAGVFLTGVLAVIFAGLSGLDRRGGPPATRASA
jgi:hypothetical protein